MKKYPVISAFQDKNSNVHYPIGAVYETNDPERSVFLQEEGFLGEQIINPKIKEKKPKPKSPPEE
jgi:hypothetical protein